jgi:hypothetical protein
MGAIGTAIDDIASAGATGTVNAKLRLMTQQLGLLTGSSAGGVLGTPTDASAAVGATGTINAHLRLMNEQLDALSSLYASSSGTAYYAALVDAASAILIAAPSSGQSIYVKSISVSNDGSAKTVIAIREGVTTKFSYSCAPNGGGAGDFLGPRGWKLAAGTMLSIQQTAVGNAYVTVTGWIGPA